MELEVRIHTLVSQSRKHCAVVCMEIIPASDCQITAVSAIDGNVQNKQSGRDPRVGAASIREGVTYLGEKGGPLEIVSGGVPLLLAPGEEKVVHFRK